MGAVDSTTRSLGILAGVEGQWIHNDGGKTTTITPQAGQNVILSKIVLNTKGGVVTIRDSAIGVIGVISATAVEGGYDYEIPIKGNLIVENPSTCDITIKFINR